MLETLKRIKFCLAFLDTLSINESHLRVHFTQNQNTAENVPLYSITIFAVFTQRPAPVSSIYKSAG